MDHLPLPIDDHAHTPLQVPYLGSEGPLYDDLGFLTYPQRVGVDVDRLRTGNYSYAFLRASAPFLQEWLWFGLLGETLGIGSRVDAPQRIASRASFIAEVEDGALVITTSKLHYFLLLASTKNHAPLFNEFHRARFDACVGQALEVVVSILSKLPFKARTPLPTVYRILLSIQILGETLLAARGILFPGYRSRQLPISSFLPQGGTVLVNVLLFQAGWCPNEIQKLPAEVILRYYCSFFNRHEPMRDHKACDEEQCAWPPMPDNGIHPVHTSDHCSCEDVTIPNDRIIQIIEMGRAPLLTFSEISGGKRQLSITELSFLTPQNFVAISHVRSKGLGNSLSNTLPYCQLSLIQKLADDLFTLGEHSIPFWIDTMCVPIPKKARKQAFTQIRQIYQQSSKVIVLDPSLYRYNVASSQECLLRIKCSSWAKRLWTLQEGALAQSLYFRFSNCVRRLEDLLVDNAKSLGFLLLPQRRTPTEGDVDLKQLSEVLALLDNDIKVVDSIFSEDQEQGRPYEKHKLLAILRLGYLAFPQFYFLNDEDETRKSRTVVNFLLKVYKEPLNIENALTKTSDTELLLRRLSVVSAVDLIAEMKAQWGF